MIFTEIYKNAIKKEVQKIYDLAWAELVEEQKDLVKILEKIFKKWYNLALQELKSNEKLKLNEFLEIFEKENIKKFADSDDLEKISKKLENSFLIWAEKLEKSFEKNPKINISFWLSDENAVKYAKEKWSKLISQVDDYTKQRIANLVADWIENNKGYGFVAKQLKTDYAFSSYRANLIASNELGNAYIEWKDEQFQKYRKKFKKDGFKCWISHRDNKTSEGCLINDHQGRIPYSENFESWHEKPTRFPWCRCNIVYNILNPDEYLDDENATESDLLQAKIPKNTTFNPWIKPLDYDKFSTNIIWPNFFNEIWTWLKYVDEWWVAHYNTLTKEVNLPLAFSTIARKYNEVHELWHAFFDTKIFTNEENMQKFLEIFNISLEEFGEKLKDKNFLDLLENKKGFWKISLIYMKNKKVNEAKFDKDSFLDLVALFTNEKFWNIHEKWYYSKENLLVKYHEYFSQLNQVYFLDNLYIKEFLPKTYENMKNFYKKYLNLDFKE